MVGDRLHRGEHRFRLQHHAGAAAVGLIVHLAVAVGSEIAGIVEMQLSDAATEGTADHPQLEQRGKGLRRQAHHIEAIGRHRGSGGRFGHPADVTWR